jgi:hypothetical protein
MSAVPAGVMPASLEPVPPQPEPGGPLARLMGLHIRDVAVFGAFLAIFAMALKPVVDNDVFWHLATGRYMWVTGRIPHADPFSWTVPGRPWIAHEWLTELWLYPLYRYGGYAALMLVFAAIITAAFAVSYATARLLGASRPLGVGVTVLAAVASSHTWGVRPQMISMLLMALTAWLLTRAGLPALPAAQDNGHAAAGRRRALWVLPALMVVWVNLHGGFIFGLALIGIFALGQSAEAWWARRARRADAHGRQWARSWPLLALCIAACLLNPNGLKGLIYPFSYLGNNASTRYIAEWVSPDFHQMQYQFFEALLLAMIAGVALSPRRPRVTEVLLMLAFTYLGLDSVRNINLFAVIVAPLIAVYLSCVWRAWRTRNLADAPSGRTTRPGVTPAKAVLNLALAAVIAGGVLVESAPSLADAHNVQMQARRFPAGAEAYLRAHRPAGPLLNSYDWGGYLIWTLYPRVRVYVDGRPDMYGDHFMDDFVHTWHAQPGWQATLRRRGVRLVLVEPTSGLGHALATARGWRVAYHDAVSVLYERIS